MLHTLRKRRSIILLLGLVLGILIVVLCCSNSRYWKRLRYISKCYDNHAYHVSLLLSDPNKMPFPQELQNTLVPITAQPETHGVKILQTVFCTNLETLYIAVRYPVNLDAVFFLNIDGEQVYRASILETCGIQYKLQESTFDLSGYSAVTSDNTALELYQRQTDDLVLLETIMQ